MDIPNGTVTLLIDGTQVTITCIRGEATWSSPDDSPSARKLLAALDDATAGAASTHGTPTDWALACIRRAFRFENALPAYQVLSSEPGEPWPEQDLPPGAVH